MFDIRPLMMAILFMTAVPACSGDAPASATTDASTTDTADVASDMGKDASEALPPALANRTVLVTGGAKTRELLAWARTFPRRLDKPVDIEALHALLRRIVTG